ncbi:MAG: ATP-binding cassette domain-containing protein, partial [Bacillota bacterium]|nr:ATP-binding cassette domain-containing protein [Bacillota bacterium]
METVLEMRGICKAFPGVQALDQVDFAVAPGEVHALLGENGAGKSTLIKILAGLYTPDSGEIFFRGERLTRLKPDQIQARGIGFIHQERTYIPYFTVGETLFLGREPRRRTGLIHWRRLYREAEEVLSSTVGLAIDPRTRMAQLTVSERQLVDIARVLLTRPSLVVFDEPTGPLSEGEIQRLFSVIRHLRQQGVTVIYISHRLDEIFQLCDRATILKDGRKVATVSVAETSPEAVVRLMVGRELKEQFPKLSLTPGEPVLEVTGL